MLYLLPNLLDVEASHALLLPAGVDLAVASLNGLIAESEKGARAYLRRFSFPEGKTFRDIPLRLLNEHTLEKEIDDLLKPLIAGERWGVVSDCGLPCLADPGANLVFRARQLGIAIEAFSGPSSIVLALMLSGLPGQVFTFHGYLPREEADLVKMIQGLQGQKGTQICIEAPYRSQKLLERLIQTLSPDTLLSCAWDLTAPSQGVITQPVKAWRRGTLPRLDKKPAVFLFV